MSRLYPLWIFLCLALASTAAAQTATPTSTSTPTSTATAPDNIRHQEAANLVEGSENLDGVHIRRVKPCVGPDNTCTDISTSNPVPVSLSSAASEQTPVPMVTVLATAIPTTNPTPQLANSQAATSYGCCNNTNGDVTMTESGGTARRPIYSGKCFIANPAERGQKMSGGLAISRNGAIPTTGQVDCWMYTK